MRTGVSLSLVILLCAGVSRSTRHRSEHVPGSGGIDQKREVGSQSQTEGELQQLFREWINIELSLDTLVAKRFMAEDFAMIGPRGDVVRRETILNDLRHPDTSTTTTVADVDSMVVRVYVDVAAMTGVIHVSGRARDRPYDARLRFLCVFTKQRRAWRGSLYQVTFIRPAPTAPANN